MAKLAKSRREKTTTKAKASVRKVVERALSMRSKNKNNNAASEKTKEKVASTPVEGTASSAKKISQKFLEAMEKRKSQGGWGARKGSMFGKPPARRGRRPKASAEYTPENSNEEGYVLEEQFERIEYDTGISYKSQGGDDSSFSMDRFDDFDEELNFDR